MAAYKIERVRGVNDILPDQYHALKQIETTLAGVFARFGYAPLGLPVLEHTDLYLQKSGEEIIARMYDFTYQNRRLCLRPEMTASAIRAYIDHFQQERPPVRLYYSGPVFRYEKPQRATQRQFTQTGAELIGVSGALADGEIIGMACRGLDAVGLDGYRVVIGHIGILTHFLQGLTIDGRLQHFLLRSMESLRKHGTAFVMHQLRTLYPGLSDGDALPEAASAPPRMLVALLQTLDDDSARAAVLEFLAHLNLNLDGNRDIDEIVDRLLHKLKRQDQSPALNRALQFMDELGRLSGEPGAVLDSARAILSRYGVDHVALEELASVVSLLHCYNIPPERITLDLGLGRGLQYYTGMIFEIHHGEGADEQQLCGGGRYDDLVETLGGGQDLPATGFSYGLERLYHALALEAKLPTAQGAAADVLLIPVSVADQQDALCIAECLRAENLAVEVDITDRSIKSGLRYAGKANIPITVLVGAEERASGEIVIKEMHTRREYRVNAKEAGDKIKTLLSMRGDIIL